MGSNKDVPDSSQHVAGRKQYVVRAKYNPNIVNIMHEYGGRFDKEKKVWTVWGDDKLVERIKSYDSEAQVVEQASTSKRRYVKVGRVYLRRSKKEGMYRLTITLFVSKDSLERLISGEREYAGFNIVATKKEQSW
jgi:hypothetical protein